MLELADNLPEEDPKFDSKTLKEYMDENVGQHGFEITRLSIVAGTVDWMIHSYLETLLKEE